MTRLALRSDESKEYESRGYSGGLIYSRYFDLAQAQFAPGGSTVAYAFPSAPHERTIQTGSEICRGMVKDFAAHVHSDGTTWVLFSGTLAQALNAHALAAPAKPAAWLRNVNNPEAPESLAAVSKTIKSLLRNLDADEPNHFANINLALTQVDARVANPYHAIAVLRTLYMSRSALPAWSGLQASLRSEFSIRFREMNVDSLMRGLEVHE